MFPGFSFGNVSFHRDEAVGNNRDRIDATLDQEFSEVGMITWGLPAEANFGTCLVRYLYHFWP